MLVLKDYQERALEALRFYFSECNRNDDADMAYYATTLKTFGSGIPYNPVRELPGLPYVCLRIPTGGGKTLVACHSVGIASRDLLQTENAVVLWLVPSNAIKEQTLKALQDRKHPYRQALEHELGAVSVKNVEDALYVKRADLDSGTTIIVSTMQSFRVDDTLGRRVYRDSGDLMDHFDNLGEEQLAGLEKGNGGNILHSLANVLQTRHPIVIVDEAHNARTPLSFETLARFAPSCIIEYTATPDRENNPSNVLHSVSAAELKAEAMIKLPIRLSARQNWRELFSDAIVCRNGLEKVASLERQETGEYIRPIMLLQAQPNRQDQDNITVDVVKKCLLEDHRIPKEQIAISTGAIKELEGVDILDPECPIRYVITVRALSEGWDCPFAYVLCSVAEIRAATYVEQILGRILRLPQASWKDHEELNISYAFSSSSSFADSANRLTDALIQNGFERQEAKDLIIRQSDPAPDLPLFQDPPEPGVEVTVELPEKPIVDSLPDSVKKRLVVDGDGKKITFKGVMAKEDRETLKSCLKTKEGKAAIDQAYQESQEQAAQLPGAPSKRGLEFSIPLLAIKQGELFEQFEETHFLDHPWELSKCDALLTEEGYSTERPEAQHGEIDIADQGKVVARFVSKIQKDLALFDSDTNWTTASLANWLDWKIPHPDISPNETGIFITKAIQSLIDQRGIPLERLVHDKYRVKEAVAKKMDQHRAAARKQAYQMLLDPECATPLVISPEICFSFDPRQYPYNKPYQGGYEFKKHYYPEVGDLKEQGEEYQCAQYIDLLDEVEYWVRNLERRPNHSFWLQTSTDRFYPDFVCKLKDGRFLVVEYKGEHLWNEDSKEKKALGELWAERSGGQCLFAMPVGKEEIGTIKAVM